jgi:hypothetical protein
MQLYNQTRRALVVETLEVPTTLIMRMRGLLGRSRLALGSGMLLRNCRWIHTFGMRFPIDVVFLNREMRVVRTIHAMPPWRLSPLVWAADQTLELPVTLDGRHTCEVGDQLRLIPLAAKE